MDKAIADQSDSIVKVNEITESIRKSEDELAELAKFMKTETLLGEQDERMNLLFQIVTRSQTRRAIFRDKQQEVR